MLLIKPVLVQLLALVCALSGTAQALDQTMLIDKLASAQKLSTLNDPALRPWHLKLSFQLFDRAGKPSEQGTIEEWWASPDAIKTVYSSPSYSSTEVRTKQGLYRSKGSSSAPYFVSLALQQVVDPIPSQPIVAASKLYAEKHDFGKVSQQCIMLGQETKSHYPIPLGMFPTYCMDLDKDVLNVAYDFGVQQTFRQRIGIFQGKHIAIDQVTREENREVLRAHVDTLSSFVPGINDFAPPPDFEVPSSPVEIDSKTLAAQKLKISGLNPHYPVRAKERHSFGSVVMAVTIGTDGTIHSLHLIDVPDPDLAAAAMDAARTWTYKPYLVNGVATEVNTQITINFDIR